MSGTINRNAYRKLINYDLEWLEKQEHSTEKIHIEAIVRHSPYYSYDTVDIDKVRDFLKDNISEEFAYEFYSKAMNGEFDKFE